MLERAARREREKGAAAAEGSRPGPERGRWDRRDAIALAILGGICVLFFWPLLTPDPAGRMYVVAGDFTSQFYPYHYFAAAEWWARRIPLWNPYMFGGHPFQADVQTAVFYPLSLVVNLLAGRHGLPFQALERQAVVDYLLAALFTYLFLRTTVRQRPAALLGALCFALGGYLTSYPLQQLAVLETSIWLPLVLLLLELGIRRPGKLFVWWLGAGLALAVAVLAGHPQSVLFIGYTAVAYLLFRSWSAGLLARHGDRVGSESEGVRPRISGWRVVLFGAVGFGLTAVGGAAVQVLPTMELIGLSTRAAIPYEIAASGYDYVALPGLLMPTWRGEQALYLGVVPLLLALYALRWRPRGAVLFWAVVALVALALSFGDRGYVYRLFHAVAPGFATFKGQERSAFLFSFAGAVLAAQGLAVLREGARPAGGRAWALLVLALAAAGAAGVIVFWPQNDVVAGTADLGRAGYPRLVGLLVAGGALCWLMGRATVAASGTLKKRLANIVAALLILGAVIDLLAANWHSNMSQLDPGLSAEQEAAVRFLKEQGEREGEPLRVRPQSDAALPANYGAIAALPLAAGDSPIVVQRTQDLFTSPEEWRLWQLLNVKYAVSYGPPNEALEEVFAASPLKVYRNRFSLPRAWVVEDVRLAANAAEAREMVLAAELHPGRTAVIEAPLKITPRPAGEGEPGLEQQITFDSYSPRRLYLHTRTNRDGLLVLSEMFYPGWEARLDGAVVPIYRADYILRGIALPAGEHRLEMVYNPRRFWLGLAISGGTVLAVLIVALRSWRRGAAPAGEGR